MGETTSVGKKPAMKVKQRAEHRICLGLWLEGVGSGLYKKLKGDPHSQEEWQVRTRTWSNQEKGFDVFCLVVWFGFIFIFL